LLDFGRATLLPSRFAILCPMFLATQLPETAAQQELRPPGNSFALLETDQF